MMVDISRLFVLKCNECFWNVVNVLNVVLDKGVFHEAYFTGTKAVRYFTSKI